MSEPAAAEPLEDPILRAAGVRHSFGLRGVEEPPGLTRPVQVHGTFVHDAKAPGDAAGVEADGITATEPGLAVGIVTADCVPVLLADRSGAFVAAVHAGWRGLTAGVLTLAVARLRALGARGLVAAVGPHIGPCCYEVDGPVLEAALRRFGPEGLAQATRPGRPRHAWLDLAALTRQELLSAGVPEARIGVAATACTSCDSERFHSYRRDGPRSGRLVHWIAPAERVG